MSFGVNNYKLNLPYGYKYGIHYVQAAEFFNLNIAGRL